MRVATAYAALAVLLAAPAATGAELPELPELIVEAPAELRAAATVVRDLDRRRFATAARLTGVRGPQSPIRVSLIAEGAPPATEVPAWISGYAYGSLGRVVLLPERTPSYPDDTLDQLLLHELTHVLVARAARGRPVPRWFNEGLAMMAGSGWGLEDRGRLTFAMVRRTERPLAEIDELFHGEPAEVRRAYALSGALVRDIVLRYGRPAPRRILASIGRGASFPDAFRDATGSRLAGAVSSFWQRHSFWYRWVPLLGSSFTLWLLIVLLAFAAWWRKRRRVAALERAWVEEEAWSPPASRDRPPVHFVQPRPGSGHDDAKGEERTTMSDEIRRIAVSTGGGDAPGLNAVIRAVTLAALRRRWEVVGIQRGYEGLLDTHETMTLDHRAVRGISHLGGTILGTANRGNPFEYPQRQAGGETVAIDRSDELVENFHRLGLDAMISIGGDGSMAIAYGLCQKGLPIVGVPKTIDNDLDGTVVTFGFQTAVSVATDAVDRLHSTAEAHERVFVVEVMGRYAGWIALHAALGGGADVALIPEIPFDIQSVCDKVMDREARGRRFSIVVVAEGAKPAGGELALLEGAQPGANERLGGIGEQVAAEIARRTGKETRTVVLGHLQRGGRPEPYDRLLALRFGAAAVRVVARREFSVMVALDPPEVKTVPLSEAIGRMKLVPLDGDTVCTARELGLCLGDTWR